MERMRMNSVALRHIGTQKRAALAPAKMEGRKRRKLGAASTDGSVHLQVVPGSEVEEPTNVQPIVTTVVVPKDNHSLGVFVFLPTELRHLIFLMLDYAALGHLALASTQMCSLVQSFMYTNTGLREVLPKSPSSFLDVVDPEHYASLGQLLKRITALQTLRSKLKTASFFLRKLEPTHTAISEFAGTATAYECFGRLLTIYVAGWEDYEKARAYCLIQSISRLEDRVNKVLRSSPASLPWHEKDVRLLHRLTFLTPSRNDHEYGFWMTQILKPWPITFQARLLYLLTGPEDVNGFVSWTQVCGCSSLEHTSGSVDFSELARALRVLRVHRPRDWSEDDIISIIDELTTTPNGWCLENVAQLLMLCGTEITKGVLGCRAISNRVYEISILSYYLACACVRADKKDGGNSSEYIHWFVGIMNYIVNLLPAARDRSQFLNGLIGTWHSYLTALFDDHDPSAEEGDLEELEEEFSSTLTSLTTLSTTLLAMALEHMVP